MKQSVRYIILSNHSPTKLAAEVNKALADDWKLAGSLTAVHYHSGVLFVQALTLEAAHD